MYGADQVVNDTESLAAARARGTLPLLGLFAGDHMDYRADCVADPSCTQPRLAEMAAAAIDLLSKKYGDKGYFLLVEGARIDMGHHLGQPISRPPDSRVKY
jgi:alkaline phosphatase